MADPISGQCMPPAGTSDLQPTAVGPDLANDVPEDQQAAAVTEQGVLPALDKHEAEHWPGVDTSGAAECAVCWDAEASIPFQPCGQVHLPWLCCSRFRIRYAMLGVQSAGHICDSHLAVKTC